MKRTLITLFLSALLASFAACSRDTFTDTTEVPTPNPETIAEICDNSTDDDGDTLIDCDDTDCTSTTACISTDTDPVVVEVCNDGADNDNDALIDCYDADCNSADTICGGADVTETVCTDATDNDGDGLTDCDDVDCVAEATCVADNGTADGGTVDETTSNVSSEFVYDFNPYDSSITVRYVKTDGLDVNTDGTTNSTCSLAAPCKTLEHVLTNVATASTDVIAVFEGTYDFASTLSITSAATIYGGFYYDAEGKLAANFLSHPSRLRFDSGAQLFIESGSSSVLINGFGVLGFPDRPVIKVKNSSPKLKNLRVDVKDGSMYAVAVAITNDSSETYSPSLEKCQILIGEIAFSSFNMLSLPVSVENTGAGTMNFSMVHSVVNGGKLEATSARYYSYITDLHMKNSASGIFNATLSGNRFIASNGDMVMTVVGDGISTINAANNMVIMDGRKYLLAMGMTFKGIISGSSTATLVNNLVAFTSPVSTSPSYASLGIGLVDLDSHVMNNSLLIANGNVGFGMIFGKNIRSTTSPTLSFSNNFVWMDNNTTDMSIMLGNSTTGDLSSMKNNYFANTNSTSSTVFVDNSTPYTTIADLTAVMMADVVNNNMDTTDPTIPKVSPVVVNHKFHLLLAEGSPLIDAGIDTESIPATDKDVYGKPRVANGTVDIGAVEFPAAE